MSEVTKRKKGQILNTNERQLILNLMTYSKEQNSGKSVSEIVREISKATGCSERTIYKIKKEGNKGIKLTTNKIRFRKKENKNSRNLKYDSYVKSSIRKKVYFYLSQNIPPTLNTILSLINNDAELPTFRRSTLHTLLKEIGFVYEQKGKKSLLSERSDLVKCRRDYLNEIQQYRNENRFIVYTGGTVLTLMKKNLFNTLDEQKVDNFTADNSFLNSTDLVPGAILYTIDSSSFIPNVQLQNISTDMNSIELTSNNLSFLGESSKIEVKTDKKSISEKEIQLVIMHAVSSEGFIEGSECILKENTEDFDMYENWFSEKLLPKIPANSVVVIDINSPFFKSEENIPDTTWKKQQIKTWLLLRNINVGEMNKKKELLDVVRNVRPLHSTKYKLEELAKERAVSVISLPLFHYELNPLNMVWAYVKNYVNSNVKSFKFGKIKKLVKEAFCSITQGHWNDYLNSVAKMEELLWNFNEVQENHSKVNFKKL